MEILCSKVENFQKMETSPMPWQVCFSAIFHAKSGNSALSRSQNYGAKFRDRRILEGLLYVHRIANAIRQTLSALSSYLSLGDPEAKLEWNSNLTYLMQITW